MSETMVTFPDPQEDPLQRRKRIFNEVFASPVAQMELEDISKLIKQVAYDAECMREKEAAYRRLFADKVVLLDDEKLRKLREYVPIPPSVYKDDAQERRTRPSKEKDASQPQTIKPRAKSVSAEDKNLANIAKALGMEPEAARAWLAAKKNQKAPVIQPQPENGMAQPNNDSLSEAELDREAAENEPTLPE